MKSLHVLIATGAFAVALVGSERAVVKIICPHDGGDFEAVQDFAGYASGRRLDLKRIGAISQPLAVPHCAECGFPVYRRAIGAADIARLKEIVACVRFQTEACPAPARFALGVRRAITWFDQAGEMLQTRPANSRDRLVALYLPAELSHRRGDFEPAQNRLPRLSDETNHGPARRTAVAVWLVTFNL